ncbi:MAG: right-handed parallel beta-helix repeat-containing protein, partial [Chloroflexi bacterium]|nr:right-handed parallel beta-helix repeat-containing protein [Chloroflexota bacterium]
LSSGSPALDRGLDLPEVTYDFAWSPRPQGASSDIGAYEFPKGTTAPPPPQPTQVPQPTPITQPTPTPQSTPVPQPTPVTQPTPVPSPVTGTTPPASSYYISTNGVDPSDCSGGTASNPWKTWRKAEACAAAGSTVNFMAGTYTGIFSGSGTDINFKGTQGRPIIIIPAPGAFGQVIFKQPLTLRGQWGALLNIDVNINDPSTGISIYGRQLLLQTNKIHDSSQSQCVSVFDTAIDIAIDSNEVYNCGMDPNSTTGMGEALVTTGGTNIRFTGNNIHDAVAGVLVNGGASNVTVENNRIHEIRNSAIMGSSMASPSGPSGNTNMTDGSVPVPDRYQANNVTVRDNVIYNVYQSAAIMPRGWANYVVANNTIFNVASPATFSVGDASWEFLDQTALNYAATNSYAKCTIYTGSQPCVRLNQVSTTGQIGNNIVYGFKSILEVSKGGARTLAMSNNLYYKTGFDAKTPGAYYIGGAYYSLAQLQSAGDESATIVADPRFVSASTTSPNLHLTSASPAIDRGVNLSNVVYDFDWAQRPQGRSTDVGAFEYH